MNLVPFISWLVLIGTLALEKGSRERMGLFRDLAVRRTILNSSIFRADQLELYKNALIISLLIWVMVAMIKVKNASSGLRRYIAETEPLMDIWWLLLMEQNSSEAIRKAVQNV